MSDTRPSIPITCLARCGIVPPESPLALTEAQLKGIHAWRRRVVSLWVITMGAAVLVWAASAAFALSLAAQIALGALLLALLGVATVTMRRGKCPSCGQRIRFAPRIELPLACSRCRASFYSA